MMSTRTYSIKEKLLVYDEMLRKMQLDVQKRKDIVLDGTFYKHSVRKKFIRKASGAGGIIFIEVRAVESLTQERLEQTCAGGLQAGTAYMAMATNIAYAA